jgi:hypothetical protein
MAFDSPAAEIYIQGRETPQLFKIYRNISGGTVMARRIVWRGLALIAVAIFMAGCSENPIWKERSDDSTEIPPKQIVVPDLSEDIVFGYGQTVFVESEDLTITFSDVLSDSRCPEDAVCFWPGQAEIELEFRKPDSMQDVAILMIQPGRIPIEEPELYECSLGYKVYLLCLDPYPTVDRRIPEEEYVAWIRVVPDDECCDEGSVRFTWTSPYNLQRDPIEVVDASISGDYLKVRVQYSGGCIEHWFKLYMQPTFLESYPVRANLYLSHMDNGDACDAVITRDLVFDVMKIAELYEEQYGGYDDIILNIYGYFKERPLNPLCVVYSPQ